MMASFSAFGGDLPSIALIVFHSLEGFVLWSSSSTNCLHVFLRYTFVVLVISSFICCRAGEVGSLDLRSSRALTLSNISVGTGSVPDSITRLGLHCIPWLNNAGLTKNHCCAISCV